MPAPASHLQLLHTVSRVTDYKLGLPPAVSNTIIVCRSHLQREFNTIYIQVTRFSWTPELPIFSLVTVTLNIRIWLHFSITF